MPGNPPELSELTRTVWIPELDEEDREVLELAAVEIDRYREMDRLNPSPHNAISIAVIEVISSHERTHLGTLTDRSLPVDVDATAKLHSPSRLAHVHCLHAVRQVSVAYYQ